jgi:hypothetical protein
MDLEDELIDPGPGERRRAPRHRTLKGALVVFGNHQLALDCLIRNISDGGAKISLEETLDVPEDFELLIPSEHTIVAARAVWRTGHDLGLATTGPWRPHLGEG